MDAKEKERILAGLEKKLYGFNLPMKVISEQMIRGIRQMEPIVGKKKCQELVNREVKSQDEKDYIYLKMGWL